MILDNDDDDIFSWEEDIVHEVNPPLHSTSAHARPGSSTTNVGNVDQRGK